MLSPGPQGLPGYAQGLGNEAVPFYLYGSLGGLPVGRATSDPHLSDGAAHIVQGSPAKLGLPGDVIPMLLKILPVSPPDPAGETFNGFPEMQEPGLKFPVIQN